MTTGGRRLFVDVSYARTRHGSEERPSLPRIGHFRLGSDFSREHAGHIGEHVAAFMRAANPFFAAVGDRRPLITPMPAFTLSDCASRCRSRIQQLLEDRLTNSTMP